MAGVAITRADILGSLGLGIDLIMIFSALAMYEWARKRKGASFTAAFVVWLICSGISGHSIYGWIRSNISDVQTPVARSEDLYDSVKADIKVERKRLANVYKDREETIFHTERKRLAAEAVGVQARIDKLRSSLELAPKITVVANPVEGFELAIAIGLWLLSALLWPALYGLGDEREKPHDTRKSKPPDDQNKGGDGEGGSEGNIIPFADPKAEIASWLKANARPQKGARTKASHLFEAFRASSRTRMTEQLFYRSMKAILPTKNRIRNGAGIHYTGFLLLHGDTAIAA
ncbi:hypothetical protein MnTg02_00289 [bacterium MnTg02]|nr:hypothetical protein MnTg02_00289 [bacterium MnTg02]